VRFRIDPEVVRLVAMLTAFVQVVGASLAASNAIPEAPALVLMAIGAGLQGALAAYAQGVQTPTPPQPVSEAGSGSVTR